MTSIYLIENKITGQCYVGKTMHSIEHRFYQHCHDSNNTYIDNAIAAHGESNFNLKLLHECEDDNWRYWETYYIKYCHSHWTEGGYNLSWGGDNNPMDDIEVRRRHLNACRTDEHRTKQRLSALGKRHTTESKIRMSKVQKEIYKDERLREKVKLHQPTRIAVDMLDSDGCVVQTFETLSDACRYFGKSNTNAGRLREMVDLYNKCGSRSRFWGYSWTIHKENKV